MTTVRVLSIRQPFSGWIFGKPDTRKFIENRTWKTKYRGELFIHASGKWEAGYEDIRAEEAGVDRFKTGHIIGHVNLVEIVTFDELADAFDVLEAGGQ